jgi:tetratricopeptide (TPR) repeat protein
MSDSFMARPECDSVAGARCVDQVCDRFEAAWKAAASTDQRPRIETYLRDAPEPERPALLRELVIVDVEQRFRAGETPRPEDYLARFPSLEPQWLGGALNLDRLAEVRPFGPVQVGQTISHYRIEARLGSGGMGVVYKAHDTRLGRSVALKFLPVEYTQDRWALERFQREARTASALNHPHICTIYDIEAYGGQPFFVMEFVHGQTLRELGRPRLPLERLVQLGAQVAGALAVAHAAGIVHRDIKPDNIVVRDDGYVKVVDFGLARPLPTSLVQTSDARSDSTPPGTLVGTPRYMSPEQGRAEPGTSASDIFALGIILYELATGHHPFEADSPLAVLHAIVAQTPVPVAQLNPEISAPLADLIHRMLQKDARLRPSAAEVQALLADVIRDSPTRLAGAARAPVHRQTVGRQHECAELRAGFEQAVAGRGLFQCVVGEPGIGKTTFVEDFLEDLVAESQTIFIARGRCSERLAGAEAYLPFLEALDSLLQGDTGELVARILKVIAPTWYVQLAPLTAGDSSFARVLADAKTASQERLKRELATLLQELSRIRPLVVFFDDLHWADASTIDLLAYLGNKGAALRLLLVLAYRGTDLLLSKHPFVAVKQDLQARGVCRELALELLSRQEIDCYLALEFPEHRFPEALAALIHAKTEGNPLFMVDLLRHLRARQVLTHKPGHWVLARSLPNIESELPESVRSMIERKIGQLNDQDRRLLVTASVQGNEFDAAVVAKVLTRDAADVEGRLEVLERVHGFVRRVAEREFPDGTLTLHYRFVHVLYQNALYALLTPARKASVSAAVAEALLGFYDEQRATVASELALLFEAGRDFARAADFFVLAAQNAGRIYANPEAIALLGRALANAEKLRGSARQSRIVAAALQRAPLYQTVGRYGDAIADFEKAEKAAQETGTELAQINAICGKAMAFFFMKRLAEMQQCADQAAELARQAESRLGVALAEGVLACHHLCTGDLAASESYLDRAIPVLKEEGESRTTLDAVCYRGIICHFQLEYQQAEHLLRWAQDKARELGAGFQLIHAHWLSGMALGNQGCLSGALAMLRKGMRLAELNGDRLWLPRLPNTLGWLHRELYDLETALRLDTESVRQAQEFGNAEAEANAHVNLGHDYLLLGDLRCALEHLQEAKRISDQDVWFRWRYNLRLQVEMARYWITQGDPKAAAVHAAAALQVAEVTLSRKYLAWAHKLLGDIAILEERLDEGQSRYATALAVLQHHPCPTIEWKILKAHAQVAKREKNDVKRDEFQGRALAIIQSLAGSLDDDKLRQQFLSAKAVRELHS